LSRKNMTNSSRCARTGDRSGRCGRILCKYDERVGVWESGVRARLELYAAVEEFYGTRYQSGSFSLINVGSGFSLPA
jgi:hypothetical protein